VRYRSISASIRLTQRRTCNSTFDCSPPPAPILNTRQIGQAMRIALAEGMHTDMPAAELGEAFVQRCRKIWWSIYILDRQMSSQMGVPQSIRDDEITCQLTHFPGSAQRTAALTMQIRLARIYADIARSKLNNFATVFPKHSGDETACVLRADGVQVSMAQKDACAKNSSSVSRRCSMIWQQLQRSYGTLFRCTRMSGSVAYRGCLRTYI
jgi:hypothetical protein